MSKQLAITGQKKLKKTSKTNKRDSRGGRKLGINQTTKSPEQHH